MAFENRPGGERKPKARMPSTKVGKGTQKLGMRIANNKSNQKAIVGRKAN